MTDIYMELMKALWQQNTKRVKQLLEDGADPNRRFRGQPVFWYVFPHIESNAAFDLLRKEEPITARINQLLKLLAEYGANFNAEDVEWSACFNGGFALKHYVPIQELIRLGADVNRRSLKGNTALHILIKNKERYNTDAINELDSILEAGADINEQNLAGETAFSLLCYSYLKARHIGGWRYPDLTPYENMLKALVARGADIDISTSKKRVAKDGTLEYDVTFKNGEMLFKMTPAIKELPEELQEELREIQRYNRVLVEQQEEDIEIYAR